MPDEPEALGLARADAAARRAARGAHRPGRRAGPARGPGPRRAGTGRGSTRAGSCSSGRCGCGGSGPYQLQAAIAALHDDAASPDETDWAQIAALYVALGRIAPSPVVELNRAVAVAMASGPERGLRIVDGVAATGQLEDYPYLHAARADLLRRLGRLDEAGDAYRRARELTANEAERAFLDRRIAEVSGG